MNRATTAVSSQILQSSRRALPKGTSLNSRFYAKNIPVFSSRLFCSTSTCFSTMASPINNPFSKYVPLAEKACEFLTASPDPFHVVHNCVVKLEANGYTKLDGSQPFAGKLEPGGKYYYTVEHTTLIAFCVGPKVSTAEKQAFGFHIVGGHTDSPNLRIKPRSKRMGSGCTQLAVECYGGGLWHTWFDRDLSVSGRVLVQETKPATDGTKRRGVTKTQQRLVNLKDPIARISTLAIHLQTAEERKAFAVNKENHTAPIIATKTAGQGGIGSESNKNAGKTLEKEAGNQINATSMGPSLSRWQESQEPLLLQAIASKLGVTVDSIVDFELSLYDTQDAALGGITKEFLYSARLDNLATVFTGLEGLISFSNPTTEEGKEAYDNSSDISVAVFFDHEEVGSTSAQGAGSPAISNAVERIGTALGGGPSLDPDFHQACISKSFVLSIDQAHAIHPNYAAKHESNHAPTINGGVVIKSNSNQRYATNGITGFVVRELGRLAGIPVNEFVVRNDCPCGSTIGPLVSARTGIRVVDAGMPQLSMHSVREMMGIADLTHGVTLFRTFYQRFRELDGHLCREVTK